jgi:pyruvate/2-oxoglutarate dehydrogenase complex dihydrolipoamide acyltransferase (E2) component
MRRSIKVPPLGEGVTTATLVEWTVAVGDQVVEGQALLSVALDKVDMDVPSPVSGTLVERVAGEGEEIAVGDVLCIIED